MTLLEKKKFTDFALQIGREHQSPQTGYVHYFPKEEGTHHTIPLFENFCFTLALFRSRLSDHVHEAISLLQKLLHFQLDSGAFPTYLHEYPSVEDTHLVFRILPTLFHIKKEFAHVLPSELLGLLNEALSRIDRYADTFSSFPIHTRAKIAAFRGEELPLPSIHSSIELSEYLIAVQMIDAPIPSLENLWDPELCAYIGPQEKELFSENQPTPNLLDLQMGALFTRFSARAENPGPHHFAASLVYPFSSPVELPAKEARFLNNAERATLFWGGADHLHSLISTAVSDCSEEKEKVLLHYTLPPEQPEEGHHRMELSLFIDHHPEHELFVEGEKATTFQLGETLTLRSKPHSWNIRFTLSSGEGIFFGHIMRGNRPGQIALQGENRFSSYDWRIALRTVERKAATITVEITPCH